MQAAPRKGGTPAVVATYSPGTEVDGATVTAAPAAGGWRAVTLATPWVTASGFVPAARLGPVPTAQYRRSSQTRWGLSARSGGPWIQLPAGVQVATKAGESPFGELTAPLIVLSGPATGLELPVYDLPTPFGKLNGVVHCTRLEAPAPGPGASETCVP